MDTQRLINAMTVAERRRKKVYLNTGSTMLNLAVSGRVDGGFETGKYYFFVGDSSSGKTFLSLTCLAEASIDERFSEYELVYDAVEEGALMNFKRYFGSRAASRIVDPPRGTSEFIEDFYLNADEAIRASPCVYVLDSMDGLDSRYADKKFEEEKKFLDGETDKMKGDFGDGKAAQNSRKLRRIVNQCKKNGSILLIISQTRDFISDNPFSKGPKKTRGGGHAPTFYATLEMWSSVKEKLTRQYRGKERPIGRICRVLVKKNRQTGQDQTVHVPIYHSVGIDDIGSCVDYLVDEKQWRKPKGSKKIQAKDLDVELDREKLVEYIEEEGLDRLVREIVSDVWWEIQEATAVKRKSRYD